MEVGELHTLLCKRIEVWRIDFAAVTADIRPTQVVSDDKQDVRPIVGYDSPWNGHGSRQHHQECWEINAVRSHHGLAFSDQKNVSKEDTEATHGRP
jgi:hypothetical protein